MCKLLAEAEALPRLAQSLARGETGKLSFAFVSISDYGLLPSLLREFGARYPLVRLQLTEATSDVQIDALAAGHIDAGLIVPPVPPKLRGRTFVSAGRERATRARDSGCRVERPYHASPKKCIPWVAEQFDALALTIELPFKESADRPRDDADVAAYARTFGRAVLETALALTPSLRA